MGTTFAKCIFQHFLAFFLQQVIVSSQDIYHEQPNTWSTHCYQTRATTLRVYVFFEMFHMVVFQALPDYNMQGGEPLGIKKKHQ